MKQLNLLPNRTMRSGATRLTYLLAIVLAMAGWSWLIMMGLSWALDL